MAMTFDASMRLVHSEGLPVNGYPFSVGCWFKVEAAPTKLTIVQGFGWTMDWREFFNLQLQSDSSVHMEMYNHGAYTYANGPIGTTLTAGVWQSIVHVSVSATSHVTYLNGVAGSATSDDIPFIDNANLYQVGNNTDRQFAGQLAEAAVWNVALTDDEVAAYAGGVSAACIRRASLVDHRTLLQRHDSLRGGQPAFGVEGSPTYSTHPPIRRAG